jgi:hypothetical protein
VCQIFLKLRHLQLNCRIFCFKVIKCKHVIVLRCKGGCVILSLMHLFYSPRLHTKTLLCVDIQGTKWWWWTRGDSKCLNMVSCNYQNVVAWTWIFPWELDFDHQQCASSKKTKTFLSCTILFACRWGICTKCWLTNGIIWLHESMLGYVKIENNLLEWAKLGHYALLELKILPRFWCKKV